MPVDFFFFVANGRNQEDDEQSKATRGTVLKRFEANTASNLCRG